MRHFAHVSIRDLLQGKDREPRGQARSGLRTQGQHRDRSGRARRHRSAGRGDDPHGHHRPGSDRRPHPRHLARHHRTGLGGTPTSALRRGQRHADGGSRRSYSEDGRGVLRRRQGPQEGARRPLRSEPASDRDVRRDDLRHREGHDEAHHLPPQLGRSPAPRPRGWAKHRNELARARWSAAHFPAIGPVFVGGLQVWPWWHIDEPSLETEPEIPQGDPWEPDGEPLQLHR